ncbi:hypothetical protein [Providencia rettgeri]|uniref:hypothetical protein n=1 Tax=Providencia rettgeri TaxID=587 RepID=UPI0034E061E4
MKKTHLIYLFLLSASCSSFASETNCLKDSIQINELNNFILFEETSPYDSLKEMRIRTKGSDDYLNEDSTVKFDDCGALLSLQGNQTKKFKNNDHVLISTSQINMNKIGKGWDYEFGFKMFIVDKDGTEIDLVQQKSKGKYLTNEEGKIHKSIENSNVVVSGEETKGTSETKYKINEYGKLSESIRLGTLETDNSTKKYFYDENGRLIKSQTELTTEEFSYDEMGRELSIKSVQKLFTTETSITTCRSWNDSGRCTKAEKNATTFFKGVHGQKDEKRTNQAEIEFDFVY